MNIIPCFTTHYSLSNSLLTLEEAGLTKPGNPASICDIAKSEHLKQVVIVDERIDGFIEAYKNLSKSFKPTPPKTLEEYIEDFHDKTKPNELEKAKEKAEKKLKEVTAKYELEKNWLTEPTQLIYGIKLKICDDMQEKNEDSLRNESNIIIFIKKTEGYNDLIKIWNRAWTDGFYYQGRIDWKTLSKFWTPNLILGLPFFSSFIAKNTLTMSRIIPEFPCSIRDIFVFEEIDSGLPFAPLLSKTVKEFTNESGAVLQKVKSIYYKDKKDFRSFVVAKAIHERSSWDVPRIEHLSSDRFCWESYKELVNKL